MVPSRSKWITACERDSASMMRAASVDFANESMACPFVRQPRSQCWTTWRPSIVVIWSGRLGGSPLGFTNSIFAGMALPATRCASAIKDRTTCLKIDERQTVKSGRARITGTYGKSLFSKPDATGRGAQPVHTKFIAKVVFARRQEKTALLARGGFGFLEGCRFAQAAMSSMSRSLNMRARFRKQIMPFSWAMMPSA
jgi:hypothetical protein